VLLYKLDLIDGGDIDVAALRAAKLIPTTAKYAKVVKKGEIARAVVLKGIAATAGAKAAIEAAGGRVE
jgi:large subunit ribosomal protein L15